MLLNSRTVHHLYLVLVIGIVRKKKRCVFWNDWLIVQLEKGRLVVRKIYHSSPKIELIKRSRPKFMCYVLGNLLLQSPSSNRFGCLIPQKSKPENTNGFAICTVYEELQRAIREPINHWQNTESIIQEQSAHYAFVFRERLLCRRKLKDVFLESTNFLSVIIDGADHSGFVLCHVLVKNKQQRCHVIKEWLIGALQHGRPQKLRLWTITGEYQTGANHIIESVNILMNEYKLSLSHCFTSKWKIAADKTITDSSFSSLNFWSFKAVSGMCNCVFYLWVTLVKMLTKFLVERMKHWDQMIPSRSLKFNKSWRKCFMILQSCQKCETW